MSSTRARIPSRLLVVAGTYDGVLAGWDTSDEHRDGGVADAEEMERLRRNDGEHLKMSFAMAAHEGSVRALSIASSPAPAPPRGKAAAGEGADGEAATTTTAKKKKKKKRKKRRKGRSDGDDEVDDARGGESENRPSPPPPPAPPVPGTLLSAGYDESLHVFDLRRRVQSGELRAPADLGTPTCSSFAPPVGVGATHALVGLSSGKIALYRRGGDWSVQHVLSGHGGEHGGVNCVAVHPTGRMALSGGRGDGRLCLWDLTRGRLGFVHRIPDGGRGRGRGRGRGGGTVTDVTFSDDGARYAFATDAGKVTARDVGTGEDLLDVALPSRANQIAFVGGGEGLFLAAACDDGSLPVLAVGSVSDEEDGGGGDDGGGGGGGARRAVMAIEPVDGPVAGEARFKCIRAVRGGGDVGDFLVVTANSGGVISLIDLEGAARMILSDDDGEGESRSGEEEEEEEEGFAKDKGRREKDVRSGSESDEDDGGDETPSEDEEDEDVEAAAEILDSVRVGTGARITGLGVWSHHDEAAVRDVVGDGGKNMKGAEVDEEIDTKEQEEEEDERGAKKKEERKGTKRKAGVGRHAIEMDEEAIERARVLVKQAKKRQKRKEKKKKKERGE